MFTPSYFGSWGTTALDNEGKLGVFGEFPGSAVRAHGSGQSGYPTLLNRCLTPGHPLSMVRNYDAAGRNRCVGRGPRYNPFTGNPLDPTPKTLLDVMAIGFDDPESSAREIGKSTHPFFARVGNRAPDENDFMLLMEQYLHDPVHDGEYLFKVDTFCFVFYLFCVCFYLCLCSSLLHTIKLYSKQTITEVTGQVLIHDRDKAPEGLLCRHDH